GVEHGAPNRRIAVTARCLHRLRGFPARHVGCSCGAQEVTMIKLSAALFLIGLSASNAYAVAPCSQVCRGPNEPCSLRCYLPGPFVTTCDQVYGGACVPIGIT